MRINYGNDLLVRIIYMYLLILTAICRRAIHVLRDLLSEITNGFYLSATCQAPVLCKYTNAASAHGEEVHYDILGGIFMHWWCLQWWNYDNPILCKLRYWLFIFFELAITCLCIKGMFYLKFCRHIIYSSFQLAFVLGTGENIW